MVLGVLGIVCVQGMLLPLTASFSPPPSPCTFQTEHAGFAQKSETDLGLNNLTAFAAKLFLIRMDFGLKKRASWLEEGSFSEALLQCGRMGGKGLGCNSCFWAGASWRGYPDPGLLVCSWGFEGWCCVHCINLSLQTLL